MVKAKYYAGVSYIVAESQHVIVYSLRNIDRLSNNVINTIRNVSYSVVDSRVSPFIVILEWFINITYKTPSTEAYSR